MTVTKLTDQEKIELAKAFVKAIPFATAVYVALKTHLPLDFILKHKKEIGL